MQTFFFVNFMETLFGISTIIGILLRHFMSKHGKMLRIADLYVFICCHYVNLAFALKEETGNSQSGEFLHHLIKGVFLCLKTQLKKLLGIIFFLMCFFKTAAADRQAVMK